MFGAAQVGGVTVFVDQTTKDLGAPDGSADLGTTDADVSDGWQLFQRAMRAVGAVALGVEKACQCGWPSVVCC
jgi:hypothetical protein